MVASAYTCDIKAEDAIKAITDDASKSAVARQRELASHYRWRAKVRNPDVYGDRVKQEVTASVKLVASLDEVAAAVYGKAA